VQLQRQSRIGARRDREPKGTALGLPRTQRTELEQAFLEDPLTSAEIAEQSPNLGRRAGPLVVAGKRDDDRLTGLQHAIAVPSNLERMVVSGLGGWTCRRT